MIITEIKSNKDLTEKIAKKDLAYVLIYKKGSESCWGLKDKDWNDGKYKNTTRVKKSGS